MNKVFDPKRWKLTLPVDVNNGYQGLAREVLHLDGYSHLDFFHYDTAGRLIMRCPVEGATTKGSKYPRTELREMNEDGTRAAWFPFTTERSLTVRLVIKEQPKLRAGGEGDIVIGQIHGPDDELIRLYYGFGGVIYYINDKSGPQNKELRHEILDSQGNKARVGLGVSFTYKITVRRGFLYVTVKTALGTFRSKEKISDFWKNKPCYFKAGQYVQVSATKGTKIGSGSGEGLFNYIMLG